MPMNAFHRRYCASDDWARHLERRLLPWALSGVELGDDVLEIGPGFGVTTRVFAGSDSQPSWRFRLIHLFDTVVVVDPATLPARLAGAGFADPRVEVDGPVRFRAAKP